VTLIAASPARAADDDLGPLLTALSSPEQAERTRAAEQLAALGPRARPALLSAVNGTDSAARMAAIPLLLRLPFDRPQDPEPVRAVLAAYGQGETAARKAAVAKLLVDAPQQAPAVLLRLMREDPSDDVRWSILRQLRRFTGRPDFPVASVPLDLPRPPNLALAGVALERRDPDRAMALFERAIEAELKQPTREPEIVLTFYDLAAQYVARRRYDDAAEMHRRGHVRNPAARMTRGTETTDHLQQLFVLHARHGPLKGFADDLAAHAGQLARPHLQYAVGRAYERAGQRPHADAMYRLAYLVTWHTPRDRADVGGFCERLGLDDQAEQQYDAAVAAANNDRSIEAVDARLQLALIAARRGQDLVAAERLRRLLEGDLPAGMNVEWDARGRRQRGEDARRRLEAEMHWRYLRHAKAKDSFNSIRAHLKELLRLLPDDAEIALDAVPLLVDLGRADDAAKLFAPAYQSAKAELDARPTDPQRMNALAWLCARCGQRLDEALKLATAALAIDPDNAAYLDTAAEANFRRGNVDEAIELETRALELRPTDPFMRDQLKRFKAAKR
jgi:tetratricopeptide (TPR) repeat protein